VLLLLKAADLRTLFRPIKVALLAFRQSKIQGGPCCFGRRTVPAGSAEISVDPGQSKSTGDATQTAIDISGNISPSAWTFEDDKEAL
jgi:hypothetical protein